MKKIFLTLFLFAFFNLSYNSAQSNCLVASYPFNNNANDESSNANNGTVYGASLTTDRFGNSNNAYYFDGIDDYINVQNSASLNFTGDGTISLWVKNNQDGPGALIWKRIYSGSIGWTIYYGFSDTVITNTNGNARYVRNETILGKWQNIVLTSNQGVMKLYIDGVLTDSKINTSGGFESANTPLLIGTDENNNFYKGIIDDIKIFDCALTEAEITSLYDLPLGIANIHSNNKNLAAYPNPVVDKLTIETPLQGSMEISTTEGRIIERLNIIDHITTIDLSEFPNGMYFVKVRTEKGATVNKIIKE